MKNYNWTHEDFLEILNLEGKELQDFFDYALKVKEANVGRKVYFRGLIEYSNICDKNCLYCGIRHGNESIDRYQVTEDEVMHAVHYAWENKFASVVLQSGERTDDEFTDAIARIIKRIKKETNNEIGITLSCGEQTEEVYRKWNEAGVHRYLLRIESSNPELYGKIHPRNKLHDYQVRVDALKTLKKLNYQAGTGVMIGLPFQTLDDLAHDLAFIRDMDVDMVGMGPYVEHAETPLYKFKDSLPSKEKRVELTLKMIAILRIMMKDINIASTTALQTLDPKGREKGLKVGANIIMPNLTPMKYRDGYQLYQNKPKTKDDFHDYQRELEESIKAAGDAVGYGEWGDSPHHKKKQVNYRIEKDSIGEMQIPKNVLYGIHSLRAKENFPVMEEFPVEWYQAMGDVKLAVHKSFKKFCREAQKTYSMQDLEKLHFSVFSDDKSNAIISALEEVSNGKYFDSFIIPAISGGAGTSINMNVNEIVANLALLKMNKNCGDYTVIDPVEDVNIFQSTNDVVPTSLKVALMKLFSKLEESINYLRSGIEEVEKKYRDVVRVSYTQMQTAVPSTYGKLFSAYQDALSRDWWRVSKCMERIKVINLGGSAIGTGITVPKFMIFEMSNELRNIVNLPVTRGENLVDTTSNLDSFVEVHAIIKSLAVNLEKFAGDMRLLGSDIHGNGELKLPDRQVGSSIMPGKINPVIPEYLISISHQIYANDQIITHLSAQGVLELNAYLPIIGKSLIQSLKLLIGGLKVSRDHLLSGIIIDQEVSKASLYMNPSVVTALLPYIGYNKATILAKHMKKNKQSIFEANKELQMITDEKLKEIVTPSSLLKLGFQLSDVLENSKNIKT